MSEMDKQLVVSALRATIVSQKDGVELRRLNSDYRELEGEDIPFRALGFPSVEAYIRSLTNEFSIVPKQGSLYVLAKKNETLSHIQDMIKGQNKKKKAKPAYNSSRGKFGGYNSNYNNHSYKKPSSISHNSRSTGPQATNKFSGNKTTVKPAGYKDWDDPAPYIQTAPQRKKSPPAKQVSPPRKTTPPSQGPGRPKLSKSETSKEKIRDLISEHDVTSTAGSKQPPRTKGPDKMPAPVAARTPSPSGPRLLGAGSEILSHYMSANINNLKITFNNDLCNLPPPNWKPLPVSVASTQLPPPVYSHLPTMLPVTNGPGTSPAPPSPSPEVYVELPAGTAPEAELSHLAKYLFNEEPEIHIKERQPDPKNKKFYQYYAHVQVGSLARISTLPSEYNTKEEARSSVIMLALTQFKQKKNEKLAKSLKKTTEKLNLIIDRIYSLARNSSNGIVASRLEELYEKKYGENLPPGWTSHEEIVNHPRLEVNKGAITIIYTKSPTISVKCPLPIVSDYQTLEQFVSGVRWSPVVKPATSSFQENIDLIKEVKRKIEASRKMEDFANIYYDVYLEKKGIKKDESDVKKEKSKRSPGPVSSQWDELIEPNKDNEIEKYEYDLSEDNMKNILKNYCKINVKSTTNPPTRQINILRKAKLERKPSASTLRPERKPSSNVESDKTTAFVAKSNEESEGLSTAKKRGDETSGSKEKGDGVSLLNKLIQHMEQRKKCNKIIEHGEPSGIKKTDHVKPEVINTAKQSNPDKETSTTSDEVSQESKVPKSKTPVKIGPSLHETISISGNKVLSPMSKMLKLLKDKHNSSGRQTPPPVKIEDLTNNERNLQATTSMTEKINPAATSRNEEVESNNLEKPEAATDNSKILYPPPSTRLLLLNSSLFLIQHEVENMSNVVEKLETNNDSQNLCSLSNSSHVSRSQPNDNSKDPNPPSVLENTKKHIADNHSKTFAAPFDLNNDSKSPTSNSQKLDTSSGVQVDISSQAKHFSKKQLSRSDSKSQVTTNPQKLNPPSLSNGANNLNKLNPRNLSKGANNSKKLNPPDLGKGASDSHKLGKFTSVSTDSRSQWKKEPKEQYSTSNSSDSKSQGTNHSQKLSPPPELGNDTNDSKKYQANNNSQKNDTPYEQCISYKFKAINNTNKHYTPPDPNNKSNSRPINKSKTTNSEETDPHYSRNNSKSQGIYNSWFDLAEERQVTNNNSKNPRTTKHAKEDLYNNYEARQTNPPNKYYAPEDLNNESNDSSSDWEDDYDSAAPPDVSSGSRNWYEHVSAATAQAQQGNDWYAHVSSATADLGNNLFRKNESQQRNESRHALTGNVQRRDKSSCRNGYSSSVSNRATSLYRNNSISSSGSSVGTKKNNGFNERYSNSKASSLKGKSKSPDLNRSSRVAEYRNRPNQKSRSSSRASKSSRKATISPNVILQTTKVYESKKYNQQSFKW